MPGLGFRGYTVGFGVQGFGVPCKGPLLGARGLRGGSAVQEPLVSYGIHNAPRLLRSIRRHEGLIGGLQVEGRFLSGEFGGASQRLGRGEATGRVQLAAWALPGFRVSSDLGLNSDAFCPFEIFSLGGQPN